MPRAGLPTELRTGSDRRQKRSHLTWLIAYAAVVLVFTAAIQRMSPHVTSRLATIGSLVERRTFAMDGSPYENTVDKIMIDGHYYSHQPPATAVLGAVAYYPLHLLGMRLESDAPATYVLVTFAINGIPMLVGLSLFFFALSWTSLPPFLHLPLTASLACATLILPYTTTLNSHGLCAALMCIGVYFFLLILNSERARGGALASGFAFSLCAAADHAMLAFLALLAVCLLVRPERRKLTFWFLLPTLVTLLPTFLYYYSIGHSIEPFAARPEFFLYPGSPWVSSGESTARLTGASRNSLPFAIKYGFLMLFGKRGFLLYNPLGVVAIYGMVRAIAARSKYWREALAALLGSALIVVYYAFSSANFSGASYSIRWFVAFLPLWWFFGTPALENLHSWTRWQRALLTAACGISLFYAAAGALNQWPEEWRGYQLPFHNISAVFGRRLFVPY